MLYGVGPDLLRMWARSARVQTSAELLQTQHLFHQASQLSPLGPSSLSQGLPTGTPEATAENVALAPQQSGQIPLRNWSFLEKLEFWGM